MNIAVVGHKNPDTDCTLSAIIMAKFLNKTSNSATAYIQGKLNNETKFLLETYNITTPEIKTVFGSDEKVCLVDHNEKNQGPDNFDELKITHVIDHHKISFESANPLYFRVEPLCSTASILYKMFRENGIDISKETATMMLACIMSDSLMWKSPTSTKEDKIIAEELQKISGIDDLNSFAMAMFEAKSNLGDISAHDLVQYDYKNITAGEYNLGVGTLETTDPSYALGRKEDILSAMQEIKSEQNLDFIMLSIVDILNEKNVSLVLDGDDSRVLEEVFNTSIIGNEADLGARLSRKKQIVPDLTTYFTNK